MTIVPAKPHQAPEIARLIMEAMNHDCCRYFCGPHKTLDDFHRMMTHLVEMKHSQYSYCNTLVAMEGERLVGILTSYDGAQLHRLREAFIHCAKEYLGRDFSDMEDETQAGELYLDSMTVVSDYRRQGIATALLKAGIERAAQLGIPLAGLLVDQGNPDAERLYKRVGFTVANDTMWGGHPMHHMVAPSRQANR